MTLTTSPLEVTVVRPKTSETMPTSLVNLFIMTPIAGLIVWAAFLGVGNQLFHSDINYWQSLLLVVGFRFLRGGTDWTAWTRKNPADK